MRRDRLFGLGSLLLLMAMVAYAITPSGPDTATNLSATQPGPTLGAQVNFTGGTIVTINFDEATQNPRWKGFVGNITGRFALRDASNFSLYDWTLTTVQGEVYATRYAQLVDWNAVACATPSNISNEEIELGFTVSDPDNINRTFNYTSHSSFYAGDTLIPASSCYSTFMYVSGLQQTTSFPELLLHYQKIIYTGLLENSALGFNDQNYDYQIIVPENTNQSLSSEVYYFYLELI